MQHFMNLLVNYNMTSDIAGYLWLLAGIMLLAGELTTPGLFVFIAFAGGCTLASVSAFHSYSLVFQCGALAVGTFSSFLVLRRYFAAREKAHAAPTNVYALTGARALVTKPIKPHQRGYVQVRGEQWCARSEDHSVFEPDTVVRIVRVEGNNLVIERY